MINMDILTNNSNNIINYSNLLDFIDLNGDNLETIKSQYLELMGELTVCPNISSELFYTRVSQINKMGIIIIAWINNDNKFELVGSGTVIIEPKIIRSGMFVGHIEDIVVKSNHRGKKISQNILNKLKEYAEISGCYKVILDCDSQVCPVYKLNGFDIKGVQMGKYFF